MQFLELTISFLNIACNYPVPRQLELVKGNILVLYNNFRYLSLYYLHVRIGLFLHFGMKLQMTVQPQKRYDLSANLRHLHQRVVVCQALKVFLEILLSSISLLILVPVKEVLFWEGRQA